MESRIIVIENENIHLKTILNDYQEKYENLRDIESPIKEVSNMKKMLKSNDLALSNLQKENLDLKNQIKPLEAQIKHQDNEIDLLNEKLKQISDHYEVLKEIESPTKESKKLKDILIKNENM